MTRTTTARIAGFTFLFYTAIGMCVELLAHRVNAVSGDAAKFSGIGEYATDVRIVILLTLLESISALVLAVALYWITRDEDPELAMLAMGLKACSFRKASRATWPCCGLRRRGSGQGRWTTPRRMRCVRFC